MSLLLPRPAERDGRLELHAGSLDVPGEVIDPETHTHVPGIDIGRAFERVRAQAKKVLMRHRMSTWIWIGPDALRLLRAGRLKVVVNGVAEPL